MLSRNNSFISTYVPDRTLLAIFVGKCSAPGDRHMPAWNGIAEVMGESETYGGIPVSTISGDLKMVATLRPLNSLATLCRLYLGQ